MLKGDNKMMGVDLLPHLKRNKVFVYVKTVMSSLPLSIGNQRRYINLEVRQWPERAIKCFGAPQYSNWGRTLPIPNFLSR